jgi:acyl-CoA thioester hydrolase
VDSAHHVNNAVYFDYLGECTEQVSTAYGWPMRRYLEDGNGWLVREHRIEYRQPAHLEDELEITTWLSDIKRATCVRRYVIHRVEDQALLARAYTKWAFTDLGTGRITRIPAELLEDFAENIGGEVEA